MADDPLRALLRGCRRTSATKTITDDPPQISSSHQVEPDLDFFAKSTPAEHSSASHQLNPEHTFAPLVSNSHILTALTRLNITKPTPVQQRTIPHLATHDIVAVAPTGSGKTLAYLLPLLSLELPSTHKTTNLASTPCPHTLILAPTRELADQIGRVATRLIATASLPHRLKILVSRAATAGIKAASSAAIHILVATPQRLLHAVTAGVLHLGLTTHVVLDEADELFDDRFVEQLDQVLALCGKQLSKPARIHLFSATFPPRVENLVKGVLTSPKKIFVDAGHYGGAAAINHLCEHIHQTFTFVGGRGEQGKVMAVRALLRQGLKPPVLLFVQSKDRAAELFRELVYDGVRVDAIHGDRSPAARASAVARFRAGKVWLLIATDVLARGLDFLGVNTVINYDMPSSGTAYVHRIGRTGRNGRTGSAITLFTEEDNRVVGAVVKVAKASGADVPDWLVTLGSRIRTDELRRLERRPPKRRQVGGSERPTLKGRWKRNRPNEQSANAEGNGEEKDGNADDATSHAPLPMGNVESVAAADSEPAKAKRERKRRKRKREIQEG